jgi:hypothetical protein
MAHQEVEMTEKQLSDAFYGLGWKQQKRLKARFEKERADRIFDQISAYKRKQRFLAAARGE